MYAPFDVPILDQGQTGVVFAQLHPGLCSLHAEPGAEFDVDRSTTVEWEEVEDRAPAFL